MKFPKKLFEKFRTEIIDKILKIEKTDIEKLYKIISQIKLKKKKILIFGNGAGQSIANHFV